MSKLTLEEAVAGNYCACGIHLAEATKLLRAEVKRLRSKVTAFEAIAVDLPENITTEELKQVVTAWRSAANKAAEAWAEQDKLIAAKTKVIEALETTQDNLIEAIANTLHPLWDEQKAQKEEIKRLKFMIENGLGWEDMKNDVGAKPE